MYIPSRFSCAVFCSLVAVLAQFGPASAAELEAGTKLQVFPTEVQLGSKRESQLMVAMLVFPDGSTKDVSLESDFSASDNGIVRLQDGIAFPVADGSANIVVNHAGIEHQVPVAVRNAGTETELTFRNDVLPVLTRAGCNTGRCHGQASGKDGFRLSLFGYDPQGDYQRITRELAGRRVNLATPHDCLLINKAVGAVPHSGGQRFEVGSREYRVLVEWLQAGAKPDPADMPLPVGIEVYPKEAVFSTTGMDQPLTVVAKFDDGHTRDVTENAVFISNNDGAASVNTNGLVTSVGPGTAFVMARYDQFTAGSSFTVWPRGEFTFPDLPANNYIDEIAYDHWKNLHLTPSPLASDDEFLRRVYIDLTGLLPTVEELQSFKNDKDPNKRAALVDRLLETDAFRDLWVMKWAEALQIRTVNGISEKGLELYDRWLRDQVRSGATVAEILRQIIPASGGTFSNPASNYYQTETTPQLLAESVAQAFLGMRIQCAQCHNHPFDRWTMDDYYGFAAFFSQVGYKATSDPRELAVYNAEVGTVLHPIDQRSVAPKFLGGESPKVADGQDYRAVLASWLTHGSNQAFARNVANFAWAHMFGMGIVEPYDDARVSNPPTNPRLLDAIANKIVESNFDIKPLIRDICLSRVYQLSSSRTPGNEWDERHFSHSKVRRLRAEVLLDCINQVTEAYDQWPGLPEGSRAVHLADGGTRNYFLTAFGRSTRQTPCSCEVSTAPTLSQALHLLNGEATSGKIQDGRVVEKMLEADKNVMVVVDKLYQRCLSRLPTADERSQLAAELSTSQNPKGKLEDIFWAILNSNEFIFNH